MKAYRERAYLVAHLAALFPAVLSYSDPDEPGWPVITMDTPTGQMSWHLSPDDLDLVGHVPTVPPGDPRARWDFHTTEMKYERLAALTKETATMHEAPKPSPDETKVDARTRGWRTALQGLAATVLVALAVATQDLVTPGEAIEWGTYGVAAGTAALTAVAAWVQRRFEGTRGE